MGQGDGRDRAADARAPAPARDRAPGRTDRPDRPARTDAGRRDRRHRLARDTAAGGHDDPGDAVGGLVDLDRARGVPGASRSRISSIERACSSCWSVVLVGSHMREPAGGHRRQRVASGAATRAPRPRRPRTWPRRRAAAVAAKNRASNRRGIDGGVTQRDNGTSRSVRRRRSRSSASSARVVSPRTSAERAAPIRAARPGRIRRRRRAARPPPRTARGSRRRGRRAPGRASGRRRAPRRPRPARSADRATSDAVRVGRIHPPAREDVDVRGERHRRGPVGQQRLEPGRPGRSRTTVAAGRGLDRAGSSRRRSAIGGDRGGELGPERFGVGHRQAAGEAAADVGGRPAVDRDAVARAAAPTLGAPVRRDAPRPGSAGTRRGPRRGAPRSPGRRARPRSRPRRRARGRGPSPTATARTRSDTARRTATTVRIARSAASR